MVDDQIERQRIWLEELGRTRRRIFGKKVFPDSSREFRRMRDERTRYIEEWAPPPREHKW